MGRFGWCSRKYLKKGTQVYIEGSLRTRKWQDKDGNDRYTTEIVGRTMKMLGSREGNSGSYTPAPSAADAPATTNNPSVKEPAGGDDDLPF